MGTGRDFLINDWDLSKAIGSPVIVAGFPYHDGRHFRHVSATDGRRIGQLVDDRPPLTWADATAIAPGEWIFVTLGRYIECWVPAVFEPQLAALRNEAGKAPKVQHGTPCSGPPTITSNACCRPAVTDGRCARHATQLRKNRERKTEWEARSTAMREGWRRDEQNAARAAEAVEKLRAVVADEPFSIHPDTLSTRDGFVRLPPEVAEQFAEWLAEYNDLRNL